MKRINRTVLDFCMYFSVNSLLRTMNKLAEEEFMVTGLSPSYALILMMVNKEPGITQGKISSMINFAPSTVTRFIDKLVYREFVTRQHEGKMSKIFPTEQGKEKAKIIQDAWDKLYDRYCRALGREFADKLTEDIYTANQLFQLSNQGITAVPLI